MQQPPGIVADEVAAVDGQQRLDDHVRHELADLVYVRLDGVLLLGGVEIEQVRRE